MSADFTNASTGWTRKDVWVDPVHPAGGRSPGVQTNFSFTSPLAQLPAPEPGLCQEGRLDALLEPVQLLAEVERGGLDAARGLVFGGTLPTMGGFAFGSHFEVELLDPVLERCLRCAYEVVRPGD